MCQIFSLVFPVLFSVPATGMRRLRRRGAYCFLPNKQNSSSPSVHASFRRSRGANQLTRAATNTFSRTAAARGKRGEKMRITTSEISMRTWRSFLSAAAQGAFVLIPEISHSDISYIISDPCATLAGGKHTRVEIRCAHRALLSWFTAHFSPDRLIFFSNLSHTNSRKPCA